ncbi:MAG: ABC transporter permease [Phycisphaerae bacterium]|nr:ABC transporter permease [Phycisphaerae bacterium]
MQSPVGRSLWQDAWRRLTRDRGAVVCMGIIAIYALVAVGSYAYEKVAAQKWSNWKTFEQMKDMDRRNQRPLHTDRKLLARAAAIGQLGERINALRIDSNTAVGDFITTSDEVGSAWSAFLNGLQEKKSETVDKDDLYTMTVEVPVATVVAALTDIRDRYGKDGRFKDMDFAAIERNTDQGVLAEAGSASRRDEFLGAGWTLFGTDWSGRPVLVKTLMGAKVSMTVGLMANVIAVPLGMLLGAIAGYFNGRFFRGGFIDDFIVWLYSTLMSIPGIILLIALKFAFKGKTFWILDLEGIDGMYIALGITSWIGTCRLVRAETLKLRELDYVMAARAIGRGRFAVLLRHIMPNVMHLGIINFSLGFVGAVQAEVILSYLNLGVRVGTPSWGTMIDAARQDLNAGVWWELTAAVAAMFFLVLALNIFGDRLRDALDPRLKNVS